MANTIKNKFVRMGPMNGQIQDHREGNTAPARRGIWAVPKVVHDPTDYWLVGHIMDSYMPNRLEWEPYMNNWMNERDLTWKTANQEQRVELRESYQDAKERWIEHHREHSPLLRFTEFDLEFTDELWTHVPPKNHPSARDKNGHWDRDWYKCSVRELWDRMKWAFPEHLGPGPACCSTSEIHEVFIEV